MEMSEKLVAERRARLAAERSLEQMKSELYAANQDLSVHARHLSYEIASTQEQVVSALGLAASMAGGLLEFLTDGTSAKRLHGGWAAHVVEPGGERRR